MSNDLLTRIHRLKNKGDYDKLWKKGTFIFDTNVLFDLYRIPIRTKDEIIRILRNRRLNSRIWLPFQARLEFMNGRIQRIVEQEVYFDELQSIIRNLEKQIGEAFEKFEQDKKDFHKSNRSAHIKSTDFQLDDIRERTTKLFLKTERDLASLKRKSPDFSKRDPIELQIRKLFGNRVGVAPTQARIEELNREAADRFKSSIPPGFLDGSKSKDKCSVHILGDIRIERQYGDFYMWKEIVDKTKNEELEYVAFITNDNKESWMREVKGKQIGVRVELLSEIFAAAPKLKFFHIYNTNRFLEYAKEYLHVRVSKETKSATSRLKVERFPTKYGYSNLNQPVLTEGIQTPTFEDGKVFDDPSVIGVSLVYTGLQGKVRALNAQRFLLNSVPYVSYATLRRYESYVEVLVSFVQPLSSGAYGEFMSLLSFYKYSPDDSHIINADSDR